jgi:hypothetical protein
MATDRYNRIVLTVIAACLVYLCVRDTAPPVQAQTQAQQPLEVVLVGVDRSRYSWRWGDLEVKIKEPVKVDTYHPLNVRSSDDFTVRVKEPVKVDTSSPLKIKVDPYPPLEVKVTNSPLNVNVTNR